MREKKKKQGETGGEGRESAAVSNRRVRQSSRCRTDGTGTSLLENSDVAFVR